MFFRKFLFWIKYPNNDCLFPDFTDSIATADEPSDVKKHA